LASAPTEVCPPEIRFIGVNQLKGMVHMIVIGVDTHKRTHALAAVDDGTGRVRGSREIKADEPGHLAAVRWARALDEERVWAIEDCRHVSGRLEQALLTAGERVVRVPPKMMGASRRGERERGKSDEIDALAVARAVVKDGLDRFPTAYLDEQAMEIRLLFDHREDLVKERTRMQNRLRWHLLELCPSSKRNSHAGRYRTCASSIASTGGCDGSVRALVRESHGKRSSTSARSPARPTRSSTSCSSSSVPTGRDCWPSRAAGR
jgi:transposase